MHHLTPAYGKDYKSRKEVLAAWDEGKDFVTNPFNGPNQYINKEQVAIGEQIQFRYKHMTETFIHKNKATIQTGTALSDVYQKPTSKE